MASKYRRAFIVDLENDATVSVFETVEKNHVTLEITDPFLDCDVSVILSKANLEALRDALYSVEISETAPIDGRA